MASSAPGFKLLKGFYFEALCKFSIQPLHQGPLHRDPPKTGARPPVPGCWRISPSRDWVPKSQPVPPHAPRPGRVAPSASEG